MDCKRNQEESGCPDSEVCCWDFSISMLGARTKCMTSCEHCGETSNCGLEECCLSSGECKPAG